MIIDRYLFRDDVLIASSGANYGFEKERQLGDRMLCYNRNIQPGHKDYLWTSQRLYRYVMHESGAFWSSLPDEGIPHYKALLLLQQ